MSGFIGFSRSKIASTKTTIIRCRALAHPRVLIPDAAMRTTKTKKHMQFVPGIIPSISLFIRSTYVEVHFFFSRAALFRAFYSVLHRQRVHGQANKQDATLLPCHHKLLIYIIWRTWCSQLLYVYFIFGQQVATAKVLDLLGDPSRWEEARSLLSSPPLSSTDFAKILDRYSDSNWGKHILGDLYRNQGLASIKVIACVSW